MQGDQPANALWLRVAGDALDLASLGMALASAASNKARVGFATANVLAVTALDVLCAQEFSRESTDSANTQTRKTLIIDRPAEELYQSWRNFEQLPRFMRNLESVTVGALGAKAWSRVDSSFWLGKGGAGVLPDGLRSTISWPLGSLCSTSCCDAVDYYGTSEKWPAFYDKSTCRVSSSNNHSRRAEEL